MCRRVLAVTAARRATSAGHCTSEGTVADEPDGTTVRGVFGPPPGCLVPVSRETCAGVGQHRWSPVPHPVRAPERRGLGPAGYRSSAWHAALACADIAIGDQAEIVGRNAVAERHVLRGGRQPPPGGRRRLPLHDRGASPWRSATLAARSSCAGSRRGSRSGFAGRLGNAPLPSVGRPGARPWSSSPLGMSRRSSPWRRGLPRLAWCAPGAFVPPIGRCGRRHTRATPAPASTRPTRQA